MLITQRVEIFPDRGERRDALDRRMATFVRAAGYLPILLPNDPAMAMEIQRDVKPVGVVLSGGNDLAVLGGDAPERDETEEAVVRWAEEARVPVVGVCRGLQFLAARAGGRLVRVAGHVARRHRLRGAVEREVNSFHGWGIERCGPEWEVLAASEDGLVEYARCSARRQTGIMWHPERETEIATEDIALLQRSLDV